jgi:hypothetical protein
MKRLLCLAVGHQSRPVPFPSGRFVCRRGGLDLVDATARSPAPCGKDTIGAHAGARRSPRPQLPPLPRRCRRAQGVAVRCARGALIRDQAPESSTRNERRA